MAENTQIPDCFIPITKKNSDKTICGVFNVGVTTAHEIIKAPDFPKPVRLGGRCLRYRLSEVMAWADSKRADAVPADSPSASV